MKTKVPGEGRLDAPVWIIGEAPGAEEVRVGRPFVGPAGRLLRGKLRAVGLENVRFENLMDVRPPGNSFRYFRQTAKWIPVLEQRVANLKGLLKKHRPNLVLLLGANPLTYILGREVSINEWRGFPFIHDTLKLKMMATYHPSYCLRQMHEERNPGVALALFTCDLSKAAENAKSPDLLVPDFKLILRPTFAQAMDYLEEAKQTKELLSFDIETSGLCMLCIGFCFEKDRAICIPLIHSDMTPYWKHKSQEVAILRSIRELLQSDVPKVAQNAQFDMTVLHYTYGIQVQNVVWDTMVAQHEMYVELPKSLEVLLSIYTHFPDHKKTMMQSLWRYNALDALTTLHVAEAEMKEMKERGLFDRFMKYVMPMVEPLVQVQVTGVKVDTKMRNRSLEHEQAFQKELEAALEDVLWKGFNPNASGQVQLLFNRVLGLGKERQACDVNRLQGIQERGGSAGLLAEAILRHRASTKLAGFLGSSLDEQGRLHCAYSQTGTTTGRLASRKSILGVGTNLQNLPSGLVRKMIIPG